MKFERKQIIDEKGQLRNTNLWHIEVDYNNVDDLEKLRNKLNSQIYNLKNNTNNFKNIKQEKFEACVKIMNTDISGLYSNIKLDDRPIYYVYAHCMPNKIAVKKDGITTWAATIGFNHVPFYIGKGTGQRAYELKRNETHRKVKQKLQTFEQNIEIEIIKEGLTELEALCMESKLIDIFGIMGKSGRLVNLDEGVNSKERQNIYKDSLIKLNSFYQNSLKV